MWPFTFIPIRSRPITSRALFDIVPLDTVSIPPSVSFDKEDTTVVICHFSGAAHKEVGGNQPCGSGKLPVPTVHLPDDRTVLQLWVSTRPNVALPDRAEVEAMLAVAECDGSLLLKGRFASERHLGFKTGLTAIRWLKAAIDTSDSHYGGDRTTWGNGRRLEDRACVIGWDRSPLKLHRVQNLCHVSPFLSMSNHLYFLQTRSLTLPVTCRRPTETFHGHSDPQQGGGQVQRIG